MRSTAAYSRSDIYELVAAGLEIYEASLLGLDKTGKLQDRVPITVEPGVYLAGRGGVRIEDTLVVRAGTPELLIQTTKDLLVL